MGRGKTYPKEFKDKVLRCYQEEGPMKATEKYGINKHLILQWRRLANVNTFSNVSKIKSDGDIVKKKRKRNCKYTEEFKRTVIEYFNEYSEKATVEKFKINSLISNRL